MTPTSVSTSASVIPMVAPANPGIDMDRFQIDRLLERILNRSRTAFSHRPEFIACADEITGFVLNGGKRVRPRLCISTYRILTDFPQDSLIPRPLTWVASSLELFHAFMLVHDDLIDKSPVRRERLSLHESIRHNASAFRATQISQEKAASLALVIGDMMFTIGMSMVSQAGLDARTSRNVHKIISDMLLETGLGQGLDILYEDRPLEDFEDGDHEIIDAYLYKTARYTITGPMLIGATMAKAKPDLIAALKHLGDLLGLAYQIKNDLEDLDKAYSDLDCSDLDTGKRTAILLHAYKSLNPSDRKALSLLLDQPATPTRRRELLTVLESSGAIDHAQQWVVRLRNEALAAIGDLPLSLENRQAFAQMFALEGFSLI